jgi:hypothetical protein
VAVPEILWAKFFKEEWGDVGIADVSFPGDDLELVKGAVSKALRGYFEGNQAHQKPHKAQVIGEDDRIVAQFEMRTVIGDGIEVVEGPNA